VKTANILLLFSFGMPAFPVDTHVLRVTKRLGLVPGTSTLAKAALSLEPHVGTGDHGPLHLNLIRLGREVCRPRDPRCAECPLLTVCPEGKRRMKAHATGGPGGVAAGGGRPTPGLLHSLGYPRRRKNGGHSEAGLQGSVPAEAVHREGRCAASGEAPDRGVPIGYGEGGERCRGGCSGPRMPGSEGMEPWRPVRSRAGSPHGEPRTESPSEAAQPKGKGCIA
jgi:hypothetical protein